jgi:hypothetical protein
VSQHSSEEEQVQPNVIDIHRNRGRGSKLEEPVTQHPSQQRFSSDGMWKCTDCGAETSRPHRTDEDCRLFRRAVDATSFATGMFISEAANYCSAMSPSSLKDTIERMQAL